MAPSRTSTRRARGWRPSYDGEFPTLGYQAGQWIESHCVIPDGYRQGQPYLLTDEMWRFLVDFYRVEEDAGPWPSEIGLRYTGAQLRRSQKWGKDPFAAAIIWNEALGPSRFDGWDAHGQPVGRPYPTPLITCLGTSEAQTDNTWRPLLAMARLGPIEDMPDVRDVGQTRVELSSGGKIEPATTSAPARLGAPMSFVSITESHLFVRQGSGDGGRTSLRTVCANVKRNVAGMDGRWLELTNAWDPSEGSEAEVTATSGDYDVLVDKIESIRVEDLNDDLALLTELRRQYGDSNREKGGWVNLRRIMSDCRSSRYLESDRRRFFLNEIVVGQSVYVHGEKWDAHAHPEHLQPGDTITLGFDGAKYRDGTALVACRVSDGKLFEIRVWVKPEDASDDWRVPSREVDQTIRDTFAAYDVLVMFADPWRWQDYLDAWVVEFGEDRVVEFATNQETRMDRAIERFMTAFGDDEIDNDGSSTLGAHFKDTVVVKGSRKKPRPGESELIPRYYMKLAKRADDVLIDAAVAATLAYEARGHAIEHEMQSVETEVWGFYE